MILNNGANAPYVFNPKQSIFVPGKEEKKNGGERISLYSLKKINKDIKLYSSKAETPVSNMKQSNNNNNNKEKRKVCSVSPDLL